MERMDLGEPSRTYNARQSGPARPSRTSSCMKDEDKRFEVVGAVPPGLAHLLKSVNGPVLPEFARLPKPGARDPITGTSRSWAQRYERSFTSRRTIPVSGSATRQDTRSCVHQRPPQIDGFHDERANRMNTPLRRALDKYDADKRKSEFNQGIFDVLSTQTGPGRRALHQARFAAKVAPDES